MKKISILCAFLCAQSSFASDQNRTSASSHAPISVMGDHLHHKGGWMVSYRYMKMDMDGNRIGTRQVSAREIVDSGQFRVAPTRMPMDMHMFGAMYGLSDRITLMAMTSFISNKMDHLARNGDTFTTRSSAIGDSKMAALVALYKNSSHSVHMNIGLSLPTGSSNERDDTPAMVDAILPYPMQLGSGTYDLLSGITYSGRRSDLSWGLQASATIRTDRNDEGYRLGDRTSLAAWLARDINQDLSVSLGLRYQDWDNIEGQNPTLNPGMIQTANAQLQAGNRSEVSIGANYLFNNGHRLGIEYSKPVSQDLVGPQLEADSILTIGWQKAF